MQPEHVPLHAFDLRPEVLPKVPIGQAEQADAPVSENVPGGHNEHDVEPCEDHVPAVH